jgi:FkbM family methyltransferase
MEVKPIQWLGHALRRVGNEILFRSGMSGIWIDVGAHHGERTLRYAHRNPGLRVYAFEPNLAAVAKLGGRTPNFVVIPMAVSEENGCAELHINAYDEASSLMSLSEGGVRAWKGGESFAVASTMTVPTIRLDTFLNAFGIATVDYLKIDAQGADLAVLRSAGQRILDVKEIAVEVSIAPKPVYIGAPSKDEIVSFLNSRGFSFVGATRQSFDQEENLTFIRSLGTFPSVTEAPPRGK